MMTQRRECLNDSLVGETRVTEFGIFMRERKAPAIGEIARISLLVI